MASQIDICNQALSHLGDEATVSSIDPPEGSAQAEHCARFYPLALSALLEMHPWGFATGRSLLAQVANPSSTWGFAYARPANTVTLLAVLASDAADDYSASSYARDCTYGANVPSGAYTPQPFVEEVADDGSKIILTNQAGAVARYVRLVDDPARFSPLFTETLGWLLASKLAGPVLKGETGIAAAQACMKTFVYWHGLAKDSDASSRSVSPQHQVAWVNAR